MSDSSTADREPGDGEVRDWDEISETWDQDDETRAYAAAAYASLLEILTDFDSSLGQARVIDFGCGTGLLTEKLVAAGASVFGVDTSQPMLDVLDAKVKARGWTGVQTGLVLPPDSGFDLVVCSSVCSFLSDYPAKAAELVSLLVPGGVFVQWDWERRADHDGGLSRSEIEATLGHVGLVDVSVSPSFRISIRGEEMTPLVGAGRCRRDQ